MKWIMFAIMLITTLLIGCSSSKNELYQKTDAFVESLQTTYKSYGLFRGEEYSVTTSDGLYRIFPIGRLINIKIQKSVDDEVYKDLRKDLENHYKNDIRVNSVYICNGGTIMIDCRD
jgi:hypothetical protein